MTGQQQRVRKKRAPRPEQQSNAELQRAHAAYKKRRQLRMLISAALFGLLTCFVLYRAVASNAGATAHLIFFVAGSALIIGLNYLISSNDPDPDPETTNRERQEQQQRREQERAVLAEKRAIENAERARVREEQEKKRAEEKAEQDRIEAEQRVIRDRETTELANALVQEHLRVQRENRITELMMIADSNPQRALKLASREGIDLHAEAQKRVAAGAAVVGAALGAGAQAGAEFVKHIVRGAGDKP